MNSNSLLLLLFMGVAYAGEEYFWRAWVSGSPPSDAISQRDYRGISFIVQAYVKDGLYVGQVFTNQLNANVSYRLNNTHFRTLNSDNLKVLCSSNKDKITWYPSSSSTFANERLNGAIKPVEGGINLRDNKIYIGRYLDSGNRVSYIGNIDDDNTIRYFSPTLNKGVLQYYYEVLVVNNKCS